MRTWIHFCALAMLLLPRLCWPQAAPDSGDAHVKAARSLVEKRDYAGAIGELRRALDLHPDLVEAHGMLGEALLAQGYSAEAIPHLERAQRLDLLGIALEEEHRSGQAIEKLLAALQAKPNDPDLLFYLGKAGGALLQRSFERLMRSAPDSARAHQLLAETYAAQRQMQAVESEYRKALEVAPGTRGIHLALGMIKLNGGHLDEAEAEFRVETALSPGDGEAAWRLGSVLLQKGRTREALAELLRSDRLRPQMIETLFDLGKAYDLENKSSEAEKAWLAVIALDDSGGLAAKSHFQLSQLYRRQGKAAEADRHFRRFQELQPKAPAKP
jgi:tetratricopeptide (TPR) repeat protein